MEKMTTGLSLEELEAQTAELLPERIEMRRRRRRRNGGINCTGVNVAGDDNIGADNEFQCFTVRVN